MKVRTAILIGEALDYAVAKATDHKMWRDKTPLQGWYDHNYGDYAPFEPSMEWQDGGPLIVSENLSVFPVKGAEPGYGWCCNTPLPRDEGAPWITMFGPTPLVAAMRTIVAHRFGEEVDVPDELVEPPVVTTDQLVGLPAFNMYSPEPDEDDDRPY